MKILYATALLAGLSLGTVSAQTWRYENPVTYPSPGVDYYGEVDQASFIGSDAAGNLYLSGGQNGPNFGNGHLPYNGVDDYYAVSLAPNGSVRYATTYGGPGWDEAIDGFLDPNGELYTVGNYKSVGSFPNFGPSVLTQDGGIIAKYKPSGAVAWARSLGYDRTTAITKNVHNQLFAFTMDHGYSGIAFHRLDTAGNIKKFIPPFGQNSNWSYVLDAMALPDGSVMISGESRSANILGYPIDPAAQNRWGMLARLDTAGNVMWVHKFGDVGCGFRMTKDANGNALVFTRKSNGSDSLSKEYYILRVNAANGGIMNTYRTYALRNNPDVTDGSNFPTIVNLPGGGFAVSFQLDQQTLLAPWNNVDLGSGTLNGVVEIFNSAGALQQVVPMKATSGSRAQPSCMVALPDGRLAITGWSQGTVDFGNGQVLTTPYQNNWDIFTAYLTTAPPPPSLWPKTFGAANDDFVKGVVRDAAGNVYASISFRGTIDLNGTSLTSTSATRRDMALVKYNDFGTLQWVKKIGNGTFDMEPQGVNVDGAGNIYWAGSFAGSVGFSSVSGTLNLTGAGSYDAFVAKFRPSDGNCTWARRVGSTGNDYLYACFVSNSGNVYAGGSYGATFNFPTTSGPITMSNAGGLDGFIVKFDQDGNGIWANRAASSGNDEVKSIEYNGGDLVACGYMGNNCTFGPTTLPGIGGSRDGWAARINSLGGYVWVKNFGTIFNDEAQSICMDPSTGNVFVAAQVADAPMSFNSVSYAPKGGNDIAVVGWNFYNQNPVWASRVGSTSGDAPATIRWDGQRLALAGYVGGSFTAAPGLTLTTNGGQDAVLMRYDKFSGTITSGQLIGGPGSDRAYTLFCNTTNREAFVGGVFSNTATLPVNTPRTSDGMYDGFLARVSAPNNARFIDDEPVNVAAGSLKAYPVPFTNQLTIETEQSVELLDLQGRRMAAVASQNGQAVLKVSSLKAGIYLVRTADGKVARVVKE